MTRTGNDYAEETVRLALVMLGLSGTPGDESTYEYAKTAQRLADYGYEVPESTLRRWARQHPDYISDIKLVFDEAVYKELKGIIDVGVEVTRLALERIREKLKEGGELTANEAKLIMTTVAIAMDKKKVLDAAKARDEHDAQGKFEFSPHPPEVVEPPGKARPELAEGRLKADGKPAPPVHKDQTDLESAAGEA